MSAQTSQEQTRNPIIKHYVCKDEDRFYKSIAKFRYLVEVYVPEHEREWAESKLLDDTIVDKNMYTDLVKVSRWIYHAPDEEFSKVLKLSDKAKSENMARLTNPTFPLCELDFCYRANVVLSCDHQYCTSCYDIIQYLSSENLTPTCICCPNTTISYAKDISPNLMYPVNYLTLALDVRIAVVGLYTQMKSCFITIT